jgi:hypothetical protein
MVNTIYHVPSNEICTIKKNNARIIAKKPQILISSSFLIRLVKNFMSLPGAKIAGSANTSKYTTSRNKINFGMPIMEMIGKEIKKEKLFSDRDELQVFKKRKNASPDTRHDSSSFGRQGLRF